MSRTNPLSSAFWADAAPGEPGSYAALEARRRIAEQLAGKKSPFPKTIGEGLTYVGESLVERARMNELADAEARQGAIDRQAMAGPIGPPAPPVMPPDAAPAARAEAPAETPAEPPPPPYATAANVPGAPPPTPPPLGSSAIEAGVMPGQMAMGRDRLAGMLAGRQGELGFTPPTGLPPDQSAATPMAPRPLPPLPNALMASLQTKPVAGPDSPANWGGGRLAQVPTDPASVPPGTFPPSPGVSIGRGDEMVIGDEAALPPRTRVASLGGVPNIASAAASNQPVATDITPMPRVAQADTFDRRFPPVVGPAVPSPAIVPAPPPMAPNVAGTAVPKPIAPRDPGPEPRPPAPTLDMQHWERAARNPSLSPEVRAAANAKYTELRTAQREDFTRQWTVWKTEEMKARDPATALDLYHKQLTNEETKRKLEGEGFLPLTREEMAGLPKPAEGQVIYKNRLGELKFGPAPPATAAESGAQVLQKKMAEHFVGQMEAGNTAADDLRTLTQMRTLAARINTGPEAVIKQFAGQMGIKTEGISNIEALKATINRIIPQQRVPGTGTTSDFDAAMFRDSVPQMMNTPGGNALIMDTMESVARNKLARAEVAGKVVSGELSIPDGTRELLKLQGEAKTISDRVRAHIEAGGGKVPDAAASSDNSAAREWLRNNPNDPRASRFRRELGI